MIVSADILEEAARALAAHSPDGFVILGSPGEWTFAFINEAADQQFGPSAARIGEPFLEMFPASARSLISNALDAAYQSGDFERYIAKVFDDALRSPAAATKAKRDFLGAYNKLRSSRGKPAVGDDF